MDPGHRPGDRLGGWFGLSVEGGGLEQGFLGSETHSHSKCVSSSLGNEQSAASGA